MSESLAPPLPEAEDASSSATKSGISFGKKRSAISLSLSLSNRGCSVLILHFESARCAVESCRCSCSLEPNFNQSLFPKSQP